MSKEERYVEHTTAWELPNGDSVTKSNYNLVDIETKYMPIQTEVICDDKDKTIADLEVKLAESEKLKESYRLQNEDHHLQLLQFYSRLGVEAFGADIHEKALETLMIMKEQLEDEKNTNAELVSLIDTMRYEDPKINELEKQLHDLPKKIVEYFYDEIRHRAILEDDYCPDHNLERKYGVRKCLLENIRTTILKKYGGEDE